MFYTFADLEGALHELVSVGAQTNLAPISLGASVPDIVRILRAHCTSKEINELMVVSISPCTDLMRRFTPTFLLEMHTELQEVATSRALLVEQCGYLTMGLWSRVRACRSELHVLRHQRSLSWARRSTSVFLDLQQSIGAREAELADLVVELEAAFTSYGQLSEDYETVVGEDRDLLDGAMALRSEAEAHLRDIRDFISSFE